MQFKPGELAELIKLISTTTAQSAGFALTPHEPLIPIGTYVLAYSPEGGLYAGTLDAVDGDTYRLIQARNVWRYQANNLADLAKNGGREGDNRVGCAVGVVVVSKVRQTIVPHLPFVTWIQDQKDWVK